MSRSHPCLGIHQYRAVKSNVVGTFLHKFFQPGVFNIIFQQRSQRTVIPCIRQTAVDLGTGVYKTSALTERNDFIHTFFSHFSNHLFDFSSISIIILLIAHIVNRQGFNSGKTYRHFLRLKTTISASEPFSPYSQTRRYLSSAVSP